MGSMPRATRPRVLVAALVAVGTLLAAGCVPPTISPHSDAGSGLRLLGSTGGSGARSCPLPEGGDAFGTAAPDEVDIDPGAVERAVWIATLNLAASVRIYRHDCLVATSGRDGETERAPQNLWSATKGVLSIIVGRAVTMGKLGLDDPIGRYLPQADAAHGAITVRQLLTQTSGLRFAWANTIASGVDRDSVAWTLTLPFDHPPGTFFEYAQTTLTTLGAVVEAAVGEDLQAFARDEVFRPLGIPDDRWTWERDGAGHTYGYAFLAMAPLDLARIGELLLHRGDWRGRRIVDAAYVDEMGRATPTNGGYGFLVWSNEGESYFTASALVRKERDHRWLAATPPDTYALSGLFDQFVYVLPSLDMVVVRTGAQGLPNWAFEMFRTLLGGLRDVRVPDPGPPPDDDLLDLSDFSKLLDLGTFPVSDPIR